MGCLCGLVISTPGFSSFPPTFLSLTKELQFVYQLLSLNKAFNSILHLFLLLLSLSLTFSSASIHLLLPLSGKKEVILTKNFVSFCKFFVIRLDLSLVLSSGFIQVISVLYRCGVYKLEIVVKTA